MQTGKMERRGQSGGATVLPAIETFHRISFKTEMEIRLESELCSVPCRKATLQRTKGSVHAKNHDGGSDDDFSSLAERLFREHTVIFTYSPRGSETMREQIVSLQASLFSFHFLSSFFLCLPSLNFLPPLSAARVLEKHLHVLKPHTRTNTTQSNIQNLHHNSTR